MRVCAWDGDADWSGRRRRDGGEVETGDMWDGWWCKKEGRVRLELRRRGWKARLGEGRRRGLSGRFYLVHAHDGVFAALVVHDYRH